jgi:hypothetical protein
MAIVYATKPGVWSDTTVWNTGALPTSADDVYSNTFTVTIDTSPTVLSISSTATTGVTAGGLFVISANGITLTADVGSGNTVLSVTVGAGLSANVVGNITSSAGSNSQAVNFSGSGTLNITGNVLSGPAGGSNFSLGVNLSGAGTLNITGSCTGGSAGGGGPDGVRINGTGTANITGICAAGTSGSGAVNIGGTLNITGTCIGGSSGATSGAANFSAMTVVGTVQASASGPGVGNGSATQVTYLTGPLLCNSPNDASAGVNPCIALRWFPADTALSTFQYQMRGATASGSPSVRPERQLFLTDAYSSGYPASNNVNNGSTYGPAGIYTGTMNIPNSSTVSFGVPVGVTTGTMIIPTMESIWNYPISGITTSGSIGERLKTAATVSTVNTILSNALR